MAARWATAPRSMTSWGLALHSMAYPVERQDITSLWSPKIDSAWVASARAETWVTPGSRLPAILYILGIISKRPWEAVNVVVSAPAVREPWTAPAAPPSDCMTETFTGWPNIFFRPSADHLSDSSAITEDGVMG